MTITDLIVDKDMELNRAIKLYDAGHISGFKRLAVDFYNEYCNFPSTLLFDEERNIYSMGIIYSRMAQFYTEDINVYATIIENAIYCFSKIITTTDNIVNKQSAAIRLLLLFKDNWGLMLQVAKNLIKTRGSQLYGDYSSLSFSILASGLEPYTYENDILRQLGHYCVKESQSNNTHTSISASEMSQYELCVKSGKFSYNEWALTKLGGKDLFDIFYGFIEEIIKTPYERRTTKL